MARSELTPESRREKSDAILKFLAGNLHELLSGAVALYWPFRGELDVMRLASQIWECGGSVALPSVISKGQPLVFRQWKAGEALHEDVLGIPYPAHGELVEPRTLVIPLLGFDRACYRLGYGAGYYDLTLASALPRPTAIGVGFEISRLETVYPQPHDVPMDLIVTELGLQRQP